MSEIFKHGHLTAWIRGFRELQKKMFFGDRRGKDEADRLIALFHQRILSTNLFPTRTHDILKAFNHKCSHTNLRTREFPVVVSDQELRVLRHKKGYEATGGTFAVCPHCAEKFTYEMLFEYVLPEYSGLGWSTAPRMDRGTKV